MKPLIVVVGSLNADLVVQVPRFPAPGETLSGSGYAMYPGGKGANQAYAAARLGGRVAMIGQIGQDAEGEWLKDGLAGAGCDVSGVTRDAGQPSGRAIITIDSTGQNCIVLVPGSNMSFTPGRLEANRGLIERAHLVLLQLEIPMDTVVAAARLAKKAGARVILDPAPAVPLPEELLRLADYVTPNETELGILAAVSVEHGAGGGASGSGSEDGGLGAVRERARALTARGARKALVKLGAEGAFLTDGNQEHFCPAIRVQVVDTTAAGDTFNGAFAVALAEGKSEAEACRFAGIAAGLSVTRRGAQTSVPSRAEVEDWREEPGPG